MANNNTLLVYCGTLSCCHTNTSIYYLGLHSQITRFLVLQMSLFWLTTHYIWLSISLVFTVWCLAANITLLANGGKFIHFYPNTVLCNLGLLCQITRFFILQMSLFWFATLYLFITLVFTGWCLASYITLMISGGKLLCCHTNTLVHSLGLFGQMRKCVVLQMGLFWFTTHYIWLSI